VDGFRVACACEVSAGVKHDVVALALIYRELLLKLFSDLSFESLFLLRRGELRRVAWRWIAP
jgi:hypothetical protein